jgi:hypothetical protein
VEKLPNRKEISEIGKELLDKFYEDVESGKVEGFLLIVKDNEGGYTTSRDFLVDSPNKMFELIGVLDVVKDEIKEDLYNQMEDTENADG